LAWPEDACTESIAALIVTADNDYVYVLGHNGLATGNLIGIAQAVK
jgi:hypothetical protein